MITKLIHTADNHLRTSQYSRTSRGKDFTRAFYSVMDLAKAEGAEAILIAGDLLDTTRPSPNTVYELLQINQRAINDRMILLLTSGNHDLTDPHWVQPIIQENSSDYGFKLIDNALFTLPSGITVFGLPYLGTAAFRQLKADGGFKPADVLMWHGAVKEMAGFPADSMISTEDFKGLSYQYGAIGDIHVPTVNKDAGFPLVYPGSTELCSASEPLEKGAMVLTFTDRQLTDYGFAKIGTRKVIPLRIHSEEDLQKCLSTIKEAADEYPIILGKYAAELADTCKRVYSIADPDKCIIRLQPMFSDTTKGRITTEEEEPKHAIEFVGNYFSPSTSVYDLACKLVNPDTSTVEALNQFVDARLEEIEKASVI